MKTRNRKTRKYKQKKRFSRKITGGKSEKYNLQDKYRLEFKRHMDELKKNEIRNNKK